MNNKRRSKKSNRGIRNGVVGRLFAQTKLPAHVTEEQDWYLDTPDVRLTRVFTIVLILHVVAVGGILAFKMIEKATTPGAVATVSTPAATAESRGETTAATAPETATQNEVAAGSASPSSTAAPAVLTDTATPGLIEYRVTSGETLIDVSRNMGVSVASIKGENDVSNGVHEGMWIRVTKGGTPATAAAPRETVAESAAAVRPPAEARRVGPPAAVERPAAVAAQPRANVYVVEKGDTAYGIARKFGIKHTALMSANGISRPELLQLGQKLKIPAQ